MKKFYILLLIAFLGVTAVSAQGKHDNKKNREEMRKEFLDFKMKFLAKEMDLNSDQQTKFYEIYPQLERERMALFHSTRQLEKKVKKNKKATDADYDAMNKAIEDARQKDAQIQKRYDEKFKSFLSGKQMYKMRQAEDKFREKMRDMRREKKKKD